MVDDLLDFDVETVVVLLLQLVGVVFGSLIKSEGKRESGWGFLLLLFLFSFADDWQLEIAAKIQCHCLLVDEFVEVRCNWADFNLR